jgi:hypothetical protein
MSWQRLRAQRRSGDVDFGFGPALMLAASCSGVAVVDAGCCCVAAGVSLLAAPSSFERPAAPQRQAPQPRTAA